MKETNDEGSGKKPSWRTILWPFGDTPKDPTPKQDQQPTQEASKKGKRGGLNLNDLGDGPAASDGQEPLPPPPPRPKEEPQKAALPPPPGEYELGLGALGKKIDSLTNESRALIEGLKGTNKSREDAIEQLKKAHKDLQEQISAKDGMIAALQRQADMKNAFPALKALAKLRKTVSELQANANKQSKEELLQWVTDSIDGAFSDLDVSLVEHAEGKKIDDIPGDQMEALRFEETRDASKANTVAKALTPCYLLKNDSKIIVIAKAQLIIFRYAPLPQNETTPCPKQETSSASTSEPPPPSSPDSTKPESQR